MSKSHWTPEYQWKELELFVTDLVNGVEIFQFTEDIAAQYVELLEYEFGSVNDTAGAPDDHTLYVRLGEMRGGDATIKPTKLNVGPSFIPLSTNNQKYSGRQVLQVPLIIAHRTTIFRRQLEVHVKNSVGVNYVVNPADVGSFFIRLRVRYHRGDASIRNVSNPVQPGGADNWAFAAN